MRALTRRTVFFGFFILGGILLKVFWQGFVHDVVRLPKHFVHGTITVEEALWKRRSIRMYTDEAIVPQELAALLKATHNTASADSVMYPGQSFNIFVYIRHVQNIPAGLYHYCSEKQELRRVNKKVAMPDIIAAVPGRDWIRKSAAMLIFSADYSRIAVPSWERGMRSSHIKIGKAVQNVYLEAASLNLGTVVMMAFYDDRVKQLFLSGSREEPVCLMPVGKPLKDAR